MAAQILYPAIQQSSNPATEEPYFYDFPAITIRDLSRLHQALADHLAIYKIKMLIGER